MTRTNSTGGSEAGGERSSGRHALAFVAALVASAVCFSLIPGDSLASSTLQAAALAAIALVAIVCADSRTMRRPRFDAFFGLRPWVAYVLIVGVLAGIASLFAAAPEGDEAGAFSRRVLLAIALCVLTGIFEEGVFRVLAMDAFVPAFGGGRRGLMRAAVASSVLFGILHVSLGDAGSAVGTVAAAQAVLKPLQAGLFGFLMVALYAATRNVWTVAGVHAAFNLLYAGPLMLAGGIQQTYVTGNPADLALLAATTLLLAPAAVAAARSLR